MNIEQLIKEVSARPCLWDITSNHYHSRLIVEKQWEGISKLMEIEADVLKKKWKNLRDQFRAELRKLPNRKYNNTTSPWPYFVPLLFLKDQMKRRTEYGSLKKKSKADILDSSPDVRAQFEFVNSEDKCTIPEVAMPVTNETPNGGLIKKQKISSELLALKKRKLELLEENHSRIQQMQRDEDELFFDSLLPHARKLKPAQKLLCRMEIQHIIYKYAYSDNENGTDTNLSVPIGLSSNSEFSPISEYKEINLLPEVISFAE